MPSIRLAAARVLGFLLILSHASAQCEQSLPGTGLEGFGGYPGSRVYATAAFDPDGDGHEPARLVVGGEFSLAGSRRASNIAVWDGEVWKELGEGVDGAVLALIQHGPDLIAAGTFTTAGGVRANGVARWDGDEWSPLGDGLLSEVRTLGVFQGELIAGGSFRGAAGEPDRVARWDGAAWQPMGSLPHFYSAMSLTVFRSELVMGTTGHQSGPGVLTWNGDSWTALPGEPLTNVQALVVHDGALIAGGSTSSIPGLATSEDFFGFLAAFFAGRSEADTNGDARIDSRDFFEFITAFFSTC